jgi:NAD(P)-dependent dehydrogenase (short-subunit alcohol dehydrogenase family)
MMQIDLSGKKVLVTGGANGLGRTMVRRLAEAGAAVAFTSRDGGALESLAQELAVPGSVHLPIQLDLSEPGMVDELFSRTEERFGNIDVLINNIGHTMEIKDPFAAVQSWKQVMDLNFFLHVDVTNKYIKGMMARNWGRIINITSIAGLEVSGPAPFNAAKAALTAYTRSIGRLLAIECSNVVMTAVAPGIVVTEGGHWDMILKTNPEHAKRYLAERTALGRFGTVDEVTGIVVFLASDHASFFHGAIIQIDGGQSRHYMYQTYLT